MARVAMRMFVLTLLTFKKVKLIFGHPVLGLGWKEYGKVKMLPSLRPSLGAYEYKYND